jgi:hypothetical protein
MARCYDDEALSTTMHYDGDVLPVRYCNGEVL